MVADMLFFLQEHSIRPHTILLWGICKLLGPNDLWWLVYDTIQCSSHLNACNITRGLWARCFFWGLPSG